MSFIHTVGGFTPMALDAQTVASGQAFLTGELEKRDPRLNEPLTSVTWMRDLPVITGGGYVETTSNYFVDYTTTGANQWGIVSSETNNIPIIQAAISKDVYPVFTWANNIKVPFIDQAKMNQVGRSLDQIFDTGLRLNWNKMLDQNVYLGFSAFNTTGLINSTDVANALAPAGVSGFRNWTAKTPAEILNDVNIAIDATYANSQYDLDGIANHILIPPAQFFYINTTPVSSAGSISILEYLKRNNAAAAKGIELEIFDSRFCISAGASSSDRMVAYRHDESKTCFDIPVPLSRAMTQPDVNQLSYLTAYVGQVGVVKMKYPTTLYYLDGI